MLRFSVPLALAMIAAAAPSQAAVLGLSGVSLTTATTFHLGSSAAFTFSYDPVAAAQFDPATYAVRTSGSGETSAYGGFLGIPLTPSLFDLSGVTIDGNLFPSYASFSSRTPIPYSLVAGDLALRYTSGSDYYYGYARLNGDSTLDIAFQDQANTAITGGEAISGPLIGAVPEPATWALMIGGFGIVGGTMRRRKTSVRVTCA